MFCPFRNESASLPECDGTYTSKLIEQHVLELVNPIKLIIEPHGDIVDTARILIYNGGDPDKRRLLSFAPTGVSGVNINGATIHSGLGINCKGQFYPLNDKQKASLRNKLSDLKLLK